MTKDWFEEWFNTSYYHTLYKNRDEQEAIRFIDRLCEFLEIKPKAKILDLACGKGRHSAHLAKKGFTTTGIDLAEQSIVKAKQTELTNVNFEVHDMRKVYKKDEFDFVFNLFTSFGYFENQDDNIDVLKGVTLNLTENGLFVLDFMNASKVIKNLVPEESKQLEGITFILKRSYDGVNIRKDIYLKDNDKNYHFQERVSAFNLHDIKKMAALADLTIVNTFGDYNLNSFDEKTSDRLILVMRVNK